PPDAAGTGTGRAVPRASRTGQEAGHRAGRMRPRTSPKPIRPPPAPGAVAEITTSSPSSRKVRGSPFTSIGSLPPQVSSMNEPRWSGPGPEIVPEAKRSPVRVDAPLTVMCASICAGDQYISRYGGRLTTWPFQATVSSMSSPHGALSRRYGSGTGSWGGVLTRAASSASRGTTHGEIEVAKLLPRNGPSGTYSQDWMSRADQSLTSTTPKTRSANSSQGTGSPRAEPVPMTN